MRTFTSFALAGLFIASGFSAALADTLYSSQELGPSADRKYIDINNNRYVLSMRQDAPGPENLHIVIENWNPGYYAEFRPGTMSGTTHSIAADFNDTQQITGYSETQDANGANTAPPRAFLYSNGSFTDLSALAPLTNAGPSGSRGTGINNRGDVVGYWTDAAGRDHGFLYSQGKMTDLGALDPANPHTQPAAINESREITGYSTAPPGSSNQAVQHPFLYDQGTMRDLGVPPSYTLATATAINDSGVVVGLTQQGNHTHNCFISQAGAAATLMPVLGQSGYPYCTASKINSAGIAVGSSTTNPAPPTFPTSAAYVYDANSGKMTDLNSLLSPTDNLVVSKRTLWDAVAINNGGDIIAKTGKDAIAYYLLTPTTVSSSDPAQYNFENTTHGWSNEGEPVATTSSSTAQKFAGAASLAVQFNGNGFVSVEVANPSALAGKTVTFHLYLAADATLEWLQPFVLEGEAGNWRWHGNWQPTSALQLNAWNTLTVDVPADAQAIWRLGVELYTTQNYNGIVYIDSVSF